MKKTAIKEAIAVFDTETTGLRLHPEATPDKQPRIIEIGIVLLSPLTGEILDEHNQLIYPEEQITEEITRITGITNDMLAGQPAWRTAREKIGHYFARASVVVAHNLPFDKAIINGELVRDGDWIKTSFPWPKREVCTVGIYREEYGKQISMKDLYLSKLGKPLAQTHRALDDVRALVEIIQHEGLWRIMS